MKAHIDYPSEVDAPRGYVWGAHGCGPGFSGYYLIRKRDGAHLVARMRPDLSVVTRHRRPARPDEFTRGELKMLVDDAFAKTASRHNPTKQTVMGRQTQSVATGSAASGTQKIDKTKLAVSDWVRSDVGMAVRLPPTVGEVLHVTRPSGSVDIVQLVSPIGHTGADTIWSVKPA